MRCLSFGYYILLVILMAIALIIFDVPDLLKPIIGLIPLGLFIYFIVGFFVECDDPRIAS